MKPQLEEEWLKSQKTCKMLPKYMGDGALILKKKGGGGTETKTNLCVLRFTLMIQICLSIVRYLLLL